MESVFIVGVGFAVGLVSAWTGLGAGLALPLLAALGIPLPGALLAVKLPVALSDAVAGFGTPTRAADRPADAAADPLLSAPMWVALVLTGAAAACLVLVLSPPGLLAVAVGLAALALIRRPAGAGPSGLVWWGAYVGACGIGFGWLRRAQVAWQGGPWSGHERGTRQLGAAANLGAVLVLAGSGLTVDGDVLTLALAQASGAWCMSMGPTWRAAPTQGPATVNEGPSS